MANELSKPAEYSAKYEKLNTSRAGKLAICKTHAKI